MPSEPGTPTLDQLQVFLAIVDVDSFAGAARKLGRATSVISYSIANLETELGISLFDRESTRKPQLTEAGRAVLSEARNVSNGINGLRARVRGLLQGLEAEVDLVLDVMLPASRVVDALKAFRAEFPTVSLRLNIEALGAVMQMVVNRVATLGVGGPFDEVVPGIERGERQDGLHGCNGRRMRLVVVGTVLAPFMIGKASPAPSRRAPRSLLVGVRTFL